LFCFDFFVSFFAVVFYVFIFFILTVLSYLLIMWP